MCVNKNSFGLTNFISGLYCLDIELVVPEELCVYLREEKGKMKILGGWEVGSGGRVGSLWEKKWMPSKQQKNFACMI